MTASDLVLVVLFCGLILLGCMLVALWLFRLSDRFRVVVRRDPSAFSSWQPTDTVGQEDWASSALFVGALAVVCIGIVAASVMVGALLLLANLLRLWLLGRVPEWSLVMIVVVLVGVLVCALAVRIVRDVRL